MNDDDQKQTPPARPLDPTRSGEDIIGDTTGMTGVTTGKAAQTSSTPDDAAKDQNKDHLPGGLTESGESVPPDLKGAERVSDAAMESLQEPGSILPEPPEQPISLSSSDDTMLSQPYNEGEQSVSGTTPDPESDDDTLANAQEAGIQLDEDLEHPKELDLGSDIDKAEAHHREQ